MKKVLLFIAVFVAGLALTSFVVGNKSSSNSDSGNSWKYHTWVTGHYCNGWGDEEKDKKTTLYIYYQEFEDGTRVYKCSLEKGGNLKYRVERNSDYKSNSSNAGCSRNYKYIAGQWMFNEHLPSFR